MCTFCTFSLVVCRFLFCYLQVQSYSVLQAYDETITIPFPHQQQHIFVQIKKREGYWFLSTTPFVPFSFSSSKRFYQKHNRNNPTQIVATTKQGKWATHLSAASALSSSTLSSMPTTRWMRRSGTRSRPPRSAKWLACTLSACDARTTQLLLALRTQRSAAAARTLSGGSAPTATGAAARCPRRGRSRRRCMLCLLHPPRQRLRRVAHLLSPRLLSLRQRAAAAALAGLGCENSSPPLALRQLLPLLLHQRRLRRRQPERERPKHLQMY